MTNLIRNRFWLALPALVLASVSWAQSGQGSGQGQQNPPKPPAQPTPPGQTAPSPPAARSISRSTFSASTPRKLWRPAKLSPKRQNNAAVECTGGAEDGNRQHVIAGQIAISLG